MNYRIKLECPPSAERDAVEDAIPPPDYQSPNHEEWARTTIHELEQIIALIRSGNFKNGEVNFGFDRDDLLSANLALQFVCTDCQELEALKLLGTQKDKKSPSYAEWSAKTLKVLHNLQMLITKNKIVSVNLQDFKTGRQDRKPLTEMRVALELKGPLSHELQAALDVLPKEGAKFKTYDEWSFATVDAIQKVEKLLLSGKINLGNFDIQVVGSK